MNAVNTYQRQAGWDAQNNDPTDKLAIYELCFQPLVGQEYMHVFECDAQGNVDLDRLGEERLMDYLYARTLIGHRFAAPLLKQVVY